MDAEARALHQALDEGKPLALVAPISTDALSGAFILQDAFKAYLHREIPVTLWSPDPEAPASALWIVSGPLPPPLEGEALQQGAIIQVGEREAGSIRYPIATQAWRLAQALLGSLETLDQGQFVVYDLETTGRSARRDEIVEIAAITLGRGQSIGDRFHSLVRPHRRISREATQIHGLRQEDVRDAPSIEAVLPRFLAYLGDAILAGHNISRFDNVILDREIGSLLERGLSHQTLDTLEMAARLLPHVNLSLASLLKHFGLQEKVAHRAGQDAEATADLLQALLGENRRQREMDALTEYLPLVALGTHASGVPMREENEILRQAALRVIRRPKAQAALARFSTLLPPEEWFEVSRYLGTLERERPAPSAGDYQWRALRSEWEDRAHLFASASPDHSLAAFLDYLATVTREDTYQPDQGAVTLMTLHNAKGKEFPVVIIVGVEEGEIPYWTAREAERLEEEQRVLYVGMTRARDRLYLTSVQEGRKRRRNPSRFLAGLPSRLIQRRYHY